EGIEWGIYRTLTSLGAAAAASLGGFIAFRYSFTPVFLLISLTSLVGSLFLVGIYKKMRTGNILFN
ncbi:MAG: hypothetical protein ABH830_02085, partial [Patescibacteria group bacterium]